ncbi:MAG: hypothetical protein AB7P04_13235 [Bacteriovoracia bacterium]
MKSYFRITGFATLFCTVLVGWFSPHVIGWYFTPPVDLSVSCGPAVAWGIDTYRKVMAWGALGGFVLATALFILVKMRKGGGAQSGKLNTP